MNAFLTQGPVGPLLIRQTVPMFWGLVSVITFNLIDAYFIAQLGTTELAAVSFTFPIHMILLNCAFGIGIGAGTVVALAAGEGDAFRVKAVITHALFLTVILIGILSCAGLLTMDILFSSLGAHGILLQFVKQYMAYIYFSVVFAAFAIVGNSSLRAIGNTFWPGVIMSVSAVINLILDPLLIFGLMGFPRLGLEGAAMATMISWVFAFGASVCVLYWKEHLLSFTRETRFYLKQAWASILHVAVPAAWTNLILPLAIAVVTAILADFGEWAVAAFGVATRIEALAFAVMTAISSIIGPFIGQNWAAKQRKRILEALRLTFMFCAGFGLFLTVFLAVSARWVVPLFDDNPEVVRAAIQFFYVVPIGYAGYGILMIVCAGYNALQKPLTAVGISMIRAFILYIPLAIVLKRAFGITGVFVSASIANILTALIAAIYFYHFIQKNGASSHKAI